MKEVQQKRYAGPFDSKHIPFEFFVQSPIGLVPKAGNQTRLIFHLSYDFPGSEKSINYYMPQDKCSVKYRDLDYTVRKCLEISRQNGNCELWFEITDLKSAFRILPTNKQT